VNAPARCVVAGGEREIAALEARLAGRAVASRRLRTSHAFHSARVEAVVPSFTAEGAQVERRPPAIPFLSNLTGSRITAAQATDRESWGGPLRQPARFAAGLNELSRLTPRVLLEVGPGQTLTALARQQGVTAVASLPGPPAAGSEPAALLAAAG